MPLNKEILKPFTDNDIYIETGMFCGESLRAALDVGFEKVISIEICEKYFNLVSIKFAADPRVTLVLGSSADKLDAIIKAIDEPITFFLDAHGFGGIGGPAPSCPLMTELDIISRHPKIKTHTILIDDFQAFGKPRDGMILIVEDAVREALLKINPDYSIYSIPSSRKPDDILVAEIK